MKYVDKNTASHFHDTGEFIGKTTPCQESKWSWWEVFKIDNKIVACVMTDYGVQCGKEISEENLRFYIDE